MFYFTKNDLGLFGSNIWNDLEILPKIKIKPKNSGTVIETCILLFKSWQPIKFYIKYLVIHPLCKK